MFAIIITTTPRFTVYFPSGNADRVKTKPNRCAFRANHFYFYPRFYLLFSIDKDRSTREFLAHFVPVTSRKNTSTMRAVSSASAAAGATSTAILGGGIGGLSAAYYLARAATAAATTHSTTHSHPPSSAPHSITLYETARRLGGWIGTEQNAAHGLRFERGPRTIRPVGERGANTLRMCADLQLDEQLIAVSRSHIAAQNRMIYANGALHSLPSSLGSLFRRLPPFSRPLIAAAWHDVRTGRSGGATLRDESIYDFAERRFGAETAKYLVSSMICGICAGDARQISVRFLMAELFEQEQRHGGVLKGWLYGKLFGGAKAKAQAAETAAAESRGLLMEAEHCGLVDRAAAERWSVYSFREGLEQLPQRLAERVERQGVSIERGADAQALWMEEDGRVSAGCSEGNDCLRQAV